MTRYNMTVDGDRVVVAVSGGPDSVCLLHILNKIKDALGIELIVAHFEHALRPDDDEDETRFAESLAASLHLQFHTKKASPALSDTCASLEEMARNARYQFLEQIKNECHAQKIAVAHNLNDQAETVLMRLLRGSGLTGLAGIPPYRDGKIIRPLIKVPRTEIEAYLDKKRMAYMTDPSNFDTRYLRNKIRLELIPLLKKYQPRILEILGQTADIMRKDDAWLQARAEAWVRGAVETYGSKEIRIPLSSFLELPEALRNHAIRHILVIIGGNLRRVSMGHVEAINRLLTANRPQAQVHLPRGLTVKRTYGKVAFTCATTKKIEPYSFTINGPGTFHLEALKGTISLEEIEVKEVQKVGASSWTAYLNADHLNYPLVLRNARPGDRFIPLGMSGHKKLKKLFIDLKIPSEARARMPILTHKNIPVWICGLRIDERFKVMPETQKALKVQLRSLTPTSHSFNESNCYQTSKKSGHSLTAS